jgi:hypothetical protein
MPCYRAGAGGRPGRALTGPGERRRAPIAHARLFRPHIFGQGMGAVGDHTGITIVLVQMPLTVF